MSRSALDAMAAAGQALVDAQRAMAACGTSPLAEAVQGAAPIYEWRHYPAGDIYDPDTHGQYFYHAHPPGDRKPSAGHEEHGHFHTFLRAGGMPAGVSPLVMPEFAVANNPAAPKAPLIPSAPEIAAGEEAEPWSHLVAIAMDATGAPLRFFTTNRWVTGETWYPAADTARMLDHFRLRAAGPSPLLNRWIVALIALYKPLLADLLLQRDAAVMDWRRRRRAKVHVLEDRRLEVTSVLPIDLEAQLAQIDAALRRVA
ncbi:MAG TPA: hypothetical protein VG328_13160 [Stellaceae bacterium]|nr:hypothetical protein [Stellaceae bacterium]